MRVRSHLRGFLLSIEKYQQVGQKECSGSADGILEEMVKKQQKH